MKISAIVATKNRCASLRTCLEYLRRSAAAFGAECEIIIADNNSDDGTAALAAEFVAADPNVFRYVFQPKGGKSRALNAAIEAARGELLAFTDDDCYVDETWFRAIADQFASDLWLGGLGGRVELFDPNNAHTSARLGRTRREVSSTADALYMLMGCNMAVRRRVIERVGLFDGNLGPGTNVVAEDIDFLYRAYHSGEKLAYIPEVVVRHDHRRAVGKQADQVMERYVRGRGAVFGKHVRRGDRTLAKEAYWEVLSRLRALRPGRLMREFRLLGWLLSGMVSRLTTRTERSFR